MACADRSRNRRHVLALVPPECRAPRADGPHRQHSRCSRPGPSACAEWYAEGRDGAAERRVGAAVNTVARRGTAMIVDMHGHYIPPDTARRVAGVPLAFGRQPGGAFSVVAGGTRRVFGAGLFDLARLRAALRRQGLERRALSVPPFCLHYELPAGAGLRWARCIGYPAHPRRASPGGRPAPQSRSQRRLHRRAPTPFKPELRCTSDPWRGSTAHIGLSCTGCGRTHPCGGPCLVRSGGGPLPDQPGDDGARRGQRVATEAIGQRATRARAAESGGWPPVLALAGASIGMVQAAEHRDGDDATWVGPGWRWRR
jgi:hypothetical protein